MRHLALSLPPWPITACRKMVASLLVPQKGPGKFQGKWWNMRDLHPTHGHSRMMIKSYPKISPVWGWVFPNPMGYPIFRQKKAVVQELKWKPVILDIMSISNPVLLVSTEYIDRCPYSGVGLGPCNQWVRNMGGSSSFINQAMGNGKKTCSPKRACNILQLKSLQHFAHSSLSPSENEQAKYGRPVIFHTYFKIPSSLLPWHPWKCEDASCSLPRDSQPAGQSSRPTSNDRPNSMEDLAHHSPWQRNLGSGKSDFARTHNLGTSNEDPLFGSPTLEWVHQGTNRRLVVGKVKHSGDTMPT